MSRLTRKQWDRALAISHLCNQVTLPKEGWYVYDDCYGEEWIPFINGMRDHILEVAFLRAIDLAGDVP